MIRLQNCCSHKMALKRSREPNARHQTAYKKRLRKRLKTYEALSGEDQPYFGLICAFDASEFIDLPEYYQVGSKVMHDAWPYLQSEIMPLRARDNQQQDKPGEEAMCGQQASQAQISNTVAATESSPTRMNRLTIYGCPQALVDRKTGVGLR